MNTDQSIKYINTHFNNIVNKKIKAFEQSIIKNYNFETIYELKNFVLCENFIINATENLNNKLTLENKKIRVDFDKNTYK